MKTAGLKLTRAGTGQWTVVHDEGYRRDPASLYRAAGVAIPVFSLRGGQSLGVGEFADLKALADWACGVGLKLIQILPINDTTSSHDWTDSYPYSAISVFALHPLYLRIEDLGYAMSAEFDAELAGCAGAAQWLEQVDYEQVMQVKTGLTRRIFKKHRKAITASPGFTAFLEENREWVVPYAVFCVKRDHFGTADFSQWGDWAVFDGERVSAMANPRQAGVAGEFPITSGCNTNWTSSFPLRPPTCMNAASRSRGICRSESTVNRWTRGPRRICSRWIPRRARRRMPSR